MFFLIEYNRQKGKLVKLKRFRASERIRAENQRLQMELAANRKKARNEIVLLEAGSENMLRYTHRRYFDSIEEGQNRIKRVVREA